MDTKIIASLQKLPESFRYIAVNGTKAPYAPNWQDSRLNLRDFTDAHANDPRCHAIGLLTGEPSGGVLSIDHDGSSCDPVVERLSGLAVDDALPRTVKFASGKPGRYQAIYWVPPKYWPYISKKTVIPTGVEGEQLEFRWNGHQSVIAGRHPETEGYQWVEGYSPENTELAIAPDWVLRQIVHLDLLLPRDRSQWTDRDWAISYLAAIQPSENYDEWLKVGMCLKSADDGLLDIWELWSSLADNHDTGECTKKWDSFKRDGLGIASLGAIAKECGWKGNNPALSKTLDKSVVAEYEGELSRISTLENAIERDLEISQLSKKHGLNFQRVESHLKYMGSRQESQQQTVFNLADFLDSTSQGLEWLIPEMLPKGESVVLAAIPKVGKTLLAVDLAYAVATGGEFLGEQIEQGRVLLVSTDESANSTSIKLTQRGFRTSDSENVRIMTRLIINDLRALESELREFRPDLVVIDSLKSICRSADISENSAEFANAIYDLKEMLTQYGASGVLIHHETKSRDAEGISRVRGSGAITGATWGIWQMSTKRVKDDDGGDSAPSGDRILTVTSRDAEGFTATIKLNPDDFSWIREFSEKENDFRTNEEKIIDYLKAGLPNFFEPREIDNALNIGDGIRKSLGRLVSKKRITKRPSDINRGCFVYGYPTTSTGNGESENHRDNCRDNAVTSRDIKNDNGRDNSECAVTSAVTRNFIPRQPNPETLATVDIQDSHVSRDKIAPLGGGNCHGTEKQAYYPSRDNHRDNAVTSRDTNSISGEELPEDCVFDLISDVVEVEVGDVWSN